LVVLLFGPPGCGKGTQAGALAERLSVPAISTGEILRRECEARTELGLRVSATLNGGALLEDRLINAIVEARISQNDCRNGFILDGYPRTVAQAAALTKWLGKKGLLPPLLVHIDVQENQLVGRVTARRQCPACGNLYNLFSKPPRTAGVCDRDETALATRADDTETVVRRRLEEYRAATGPILTWYPRDTIIDIDGGKPPQAVTEDIEQALMRMGAAAA
jgi:adenylate kinase